MGFCILGGKEGYLRKSLSDKLTSLGQTVGIGAAVADFTTAIQNIYTNRYTAGQDSLKVDRKLTLTSSQTGSNVNIADNWYTTCDASAVYTAGQNSVKTSRKLTLSASQTGTDVNITDNWYTTCDASAVYGAGQSSAKLLWAHGGRGDSQSGDDSRGFWNDSSQVTATKAQTVKIYYKRYCWKSSDGNKVSYLLNGTEHVISGNDTTLVNGTANVSVAAGNTFKLRCYGQAWTEGWNADSSACCIVF